MILSSFSNTEFEHNIKTNRNCPTSFKEKNHSACHRYFVYYREEMRIDEVLLNF